MKIIPPTTHGDSAQSEQLENYFEKLRTIEIAMRLTAKHIEEERVSQISLENVRRMAHQLAGNAGLFGYFELGDRAADLEDSIAEESNATGFRTCCILVADEIGRILAS